MPACQNESGRAVVEFGIQPVICRVACLAICRELRFNVIRISRRRKVRLVAGEASRRHRLEFTVSAGFVAGIAIDCGVCTR